MAQKKRTNNQSKQQKTRQKQAVVKAVLKTAEECGWHNVDFTVISKKTKVSEKDIHTHFKTVWDVAVYVLSDISNISEKEVKEYLTPDDWQDNIMEIIMTRFDLGAEYKPALLKLRKDILKSPDALKTMAPFFYKTMKNMMILSHMPDDYLSPVHVSSFGIFYLSVLDTWADDDSTDGTATMATIDKRLKTYAKIMQMIPPCPL